jgi:hypothetical protein
MVSRLSDSVADIAKAFGIDAETEGDKPPDLMDKIFSLFSIQEIGQARMLGEILIELAELSAVQASHFSMHLDFLQEKFELGLQFSQGVKFHGVNKINGRGMVQLIESLTLDQRKALIDWQTLATASATEGLMRDIFYEEEVERMQNVLSWLLSFSK